MTKPDFTTEDLNIKKIFSSFKYWPRILKLLWKCNYKYLIIILLLSILIGIMPVINIDATRNLINVVQKNGNNQNEVIDAFIFLIIISVLTNLISLAKNYFEGLFQNIMTYDIKSKIIDKAKKLSLADFENPEVYDKLQRAQNEAGYRPFSAFTSILTIISGIITLISSATLIFIWKWWAALILIIVPSFSTISLLKQGQREFLMHWKRAPKHRKSWYLEYLLTRDTTIKEIKLYNLGEYLVKKYKIFFKNFYKEDKRLAKKRFSLTLIFNLINELAVSLIIGLIIYSTFIGKLFIGDLYAFLSSTKLVQTNSQSVLNTMFRMYQSNLYIKQLFDFFDLPIKDTNKLSSNELLDEVKEIEFRNVSFKYPSKDVYVLRNLNFKLFAGEKIAIVGENGSGKTTFIKLLSRLYDSYEGEILINGISIKKFNLNYIRSKMSIVLQDFVKYEMTARENIGFGDLKSLDNDKEILNSAKRSGIDEFITKLPKSIDSQLGVWFDEGTQLSGGQWQKIALSRAFIRNSDVYILDEPSSALDPLSEKDIFDKFFELCENKIGIFTSHRFSTVRFANKILVFNKGKLIEQGTHEELIEINGYYSKLYNIQATPFENNIKKNTSDEYCI
ncbi:ABC transporter ATP-binding protein [Abyssisolibacter fermentans]|uniref:ABC transporter ATP-binding protein n=1 Tax=Abyssisolibacter fermentans TaxID=1766203 RepID=UPI0008335B04|nr:ABC transporter ATP-binding protein [Abyssisolibacter fermentans]